MKNFISTHWPPLVLLFLAIIIVRPLFEPGYFSHQDDLQVMRIYEMSRCLQDLQIPCRWVPDLGYGNGFPLFNYYAPLPYYIGAIASFVIGYIGAAKLLFFIPLVIGGISMYLLAKETFGKEAGFLSGVLFMFAPYRALDSYVRGAVSESFAIAIIPLVFYFTLRLIRKSSQANFFGTAVSWSLFLLSHNLMTLVFFPVLLIWMAFWIILQKQKRILLSMGSLALGFGLSAFYLIPALLERSLVQIQNLTINGLDFRANFVSLSQLFWERRWGYGLETGPQNDVISLQIGWPHWWLVGLVLAVGVVVMVNQKWRSKLDIPLENYWLSIGLLAVFFGSVLMTHNRSAFIWENLPFVSFMQFPWRFLALTIFSASLVAGLIAVVWPKKTRSFMLIFLTILTIILNYQYFQPQAYYRALDDQSKLSGTLWEKQQKGSLTDYLPLNVPKPQEAAPFNPSVASGESTVENFQNRSNGFVAMLQVKRPSVVEFPIFDFPGWTVSVNDQKVSHLHNNYLQRISVDLQPGNTVVQGRFEDTPVRFAANIIALLTVFGIMLYLLLRWTYLKRR